MFEDEPHAEGAAAVAAAREALQALCQELNLDEGSAAEALDDFTAIRGNYSLEVSGGRWAAAPTLARPHPRPAPAPSLSGGGSSPTYEGLRGVRGGKGGCSSANPPICFEAGNRRSEREPRVLRGSLDSRLSNLISARRPVPQTARCCR